MKKYVLVLAVAMVFVGCSQSGDSIAAPTGCQKVNVIIFSSTIPESVIHGGNELVDIVYGSQSADTISVCNGTRLRANWSNMIEPYYYEIDTMASAGLVWEIK
jgi:photosystem II stability/assembly factor-like uncharacterized protein